MKLNLLYITLLFLAPTLRAQNITQEMLMLNNNYTSINSYSASMKVLYYSAENEKIEEESGSYIQHGKYSRYILGPVEVLNFDNELLQLNHKDSIAVYKSSSFNNQSVNPMDNYVKRISNYLKICKDSSVTENGDNKIVHISLKSPIDNMTGITITFSKNYIIQSFEIHLVNNEKIRFEYTNVLFNKNKINKTFKRSDYVVGSGSEIHLQKKYSTYTFNNFSNQ